MRLGRHKTEPVPVAEEVTGTRRFMETVVVIAGALLLAVLIQQFLIKPYKIPSLSMAPTLTVGQRVLVNRAGTHFADPSLGEDAVDVQYPELDPATTKAQLANYVPLFGTAQTAGTIEDAALQRFAAFAAGSGLTASPITPAQLRGTGAGAPAATTAAN